MCECVYIRGENRTRKRKGRSRAVRGRLLGYCSGIRLVLIGEITETTDQSIRALEVGLGLCERRMMR